MIVESLNALSGPWWDWFGAVAWQASLYIAVVALLDRALGRFVWPQVRYAVWLLGFLKLALPPTLASPWSIAALVGRRASEVAVSPMAFPLVPLNTAPAGLTGVVLPSSPPPPPELSMMAVGLLVWLVGIAVLTVWVAVRLASVRRVLRESIDPGTEIVAALARAAERAHMERVPDLRVTDAVESPAVFGLFSPTILVPVGFPTEHAEHVFLHELAHIRRFDLPIHAATVVLQVLFWPNPFVWYALSQTMRVREICTDGTVAGLLRERTPDYRATLLNAARSYLDTPQSLVSPVGLMGLVEGSAMIIERLKHLERAPWRTTRLRTAMVLITVLVLAGTALPMGKADIPAGDVYEFWDVDKQPMPANSVFPEYPPEELAIGTIDTVDVQMVVDTDGSVESVDVLRGQPAFHEAALAAARSMRFSPAEKDGHPVRVKMSQRYVFRPPSAERTVAASAVTAEELARLGIKEPTPPVRPAGEPQSWPREVALQFVRDFKAYQDSIKTMRDAILAARGETTQPNAPMQIVKPGILSYPEAALEAGMEGDVFVELVVGRDGKVDDAKVLRGPPVFHAAALEGARQMEFAPIDDAGPEGTKFTQRISFRLRGDDEGGDGEHLSGGQVVLTVFRKRTPDADGVYQFWMLDKLPQPLDDVVPVYPPGAREAGLDGDVIVQMVLGTDGTVESAEALQGSPLFNEAALEAARKMRYTPAEVDGQPVRVKVTKKVSFRARETSTEQVPPPQGSSATDDQIQQWPNPDSWTAEKATREVLGWLYAGFRTNQGDGFQREHLEYMRSESKYASIAPTEAEIREKMTYMPDGRRSERLMEYIGQVNQVAEARWNERADRDPEIQRLRETHRNSIGEIRTLLKEHDPDGSGKISVAVARDPFGRVDYVRFDDEAPPLSDEVREQIQEVLMASWWRIGVPGEALMTIKYPEP